MSAAGTDAYGNSRCANWSGTTFPVRLLVMHRSFMELSKLGVVGAALLLTASACSSAVGANDEEPDGMNGRGPNIGEDGPNNADDPAPDDGDSPDGTPSEGAEPGADTPAPDGQPGSTPSAGPTPQPTPDECGERSLPSQPLRRLSSTEYHNTMRDLFGEDLGRRVVDGSRFPETLISSGFSTSAEANIVNTSESNAIEDNAGRIANLIDEDPDRFLTELMPCDLGASPSDGDIDGCIDTFIDTFGMRAYRRPLTTSESSLARGVYDDVRASQTARSAFAGLVQYFVQAPATLYRVERGVEGEGEFLVPLSGYERATRLSYFLRASMPDQQLFDAARDGELDTIEQVVAHAERLMQDEEFFDVVDRFHREWLERHDFEWKPPDVFPNFDAARGSLDREQGQFLRYVLNDADGRIQSLLDSSIYPVNSVLADYYGTSDGGSSEDEWVPVELPNRRGLLTQASLMATLAGSTETNAIHRGAFVQTQVLCRPLPALPGNVDIQTPLQDASGLPTARQRLAPLTESGDCSGCHNVINPAGLAFENYDAAGQWRDQENGTDIDASGVLNIDGTNVEFESPVELVEAIARSDEAEECYATNWFRSAVGRSEFSEDSCSLSDLYEATRTADGDVRAMILALVQTDAFLYTRRVEQ